MKGLTEIDGFKEKHDVDPAEISTTVQVLLHQPIVMDAWTSFAVEGQALSYQNLPVFLMPKLPIDMRKHL